MSRPLGLRTWVEVSLPALAHNYQIFRKLIGPKVKLMAVVKSNAYGHGLIGCSQYLEKLGVDWLGVDSVVEGTHLRQKGVKKPILVLGYTLPERIKEAYKFNLTITISTFDQLTALKKLYPKIPKFHLKIDTVMHRQGFLPGQTKELIDTLKRDFSPQFIGGIYTHLAAPENPKFKLATLKQLEIFDLVCEAFKQNNFSLLRHVGATGGTVAFPKHRFDLVRVGIGLYGFLPGSAQNLDLKEVLSWKTVVGEVKAVKKGEHVGYGFTEKLERDSKLDICPIGYWHGYSRLLSGRSYAIIRGQLVRIVGRVSMDMVVFDVTKVSEVAPGEEVTLIGEQGVKKVSAVELAHISKTIPYEFLTRLNPLMKRLYA